MKRFDLEMPSLAGKYIKGKTGEVVTASLGDPVGSYLFLMAQASKVKLFISEKRQMQMDIHVTVQIEEYHRTRSAQLFNYAESCTIAEYWKWHAINEFLGLIKNGHSPNAAMTYFRERYQLTDWDWPEDNMKKLYVRFKQGTANYAFKPHIIIPL